MKASVCITFYVINGRIRDTHQTYYKTSPKALRIHSSLAHLHSEKKHPTSHLLHLINLTDKTRKLSHTITQQDMSLA